MNKFMEVLKYIKFKIINNSFFKRKNKLKLQKNSTYNNISIKFSNNFIKYKNERDLEFFSEVVKFFLITMKQECKNFNSKTLIKNFKNTIFNLNDINNEEIKIEGTVSSNENTIIYTINDFSVSFHELLHLSTLSNKENICGFRYRNLGKALNEGYTEFLANRYFHKDEVDTYVFEIFIVETLEKIVGKDNMEKYYFEMSLPALIKDLEQYESNENILNFIKKLDILLENDISYIKDFDEEQFLCFQLIIKELCNFLSSCLKNKVKNMLNNKDSNIMSFILKLNLHYKIQCKRTDGKSYQIELFNEKLIDDLVKLSFNFKKSYYKK